MLTHCTLFSLLLLFGCASPSPNGISDEEAIVIKDLDLSPIQYADEELKKAGISEKFIKLIHRKYLARSSEWKDSSDKIIALSVFGFLSKSNYALHDSNAGRVKIKKYLRKHQKSFELASQTYQVPSKTIASLLWVETKLGKNTGHFDLPWVFYSLVMAAHPEFTKSMLKQLPEKLSHQDPKNSANLPYQRKVVERCQSKANWAITELKALDQIFNEKQFDPFKTKSSFAGAFGYSQFIPSSFLKHAHSPHRKRPNLFRDSDAIYSVACFLHEHGWNSSEPHSQEEALFGYNRSKDYGSVILKIASEL